jgi:hypothetical protein
MTSGALPNTLEIRTRTALPPTPIVAKSRTVVLVAVPYPQAIGDPHATRHTGAGAVVGVTAVVGGCEVVGSTVDLTVWEGFG